ncbi:MAG TPA: hypothetical protein VKZ98_10440 [Aquaticitalea sp.]|nr:hypothetical protein [Aquaticitalea sp.]
MKKQIVFLWMVMTLCCWSFKAIEGDSSKNDWLLQFNNGDSLKINITQSGCFSFGADSLVISKNFGRYYLKHQNTNRQLDSKDIDYLIHFERRLVEVTKRGGHCTSTESFVFNYKNEKRIYNDMTCDFMGVQKLFAYLKIASL